VEKDYFFGALAGNSHIRAEDVIHKQ